MAGFESGRRLCLLFEAGNGRYAVEATSVMEVANPDADGLHIRGHLELQDLSVILGGDPEGRPGAGVVLDVSPTLAVRVKKIVQVADVARAPFFQLPPGMGDVLALLVRGAILFDGQLYLELIAEALPHPKAVRAGALTRPIYLLDQTPERALAFESQGKLYGLPLPLVSQVVTATRAYTPLPFSTGPVAGLFPHAQALWPIYSAAGLLGGPALREEMFVLAELAGQNVGICASRVLGVKAGLTATETRGEYAAPGLTEPMLFLDFQRMFS